MSEPKRYLNRLNGWEQVGGAAAANVAELPHLEAPVAKLNGLLAEARSLSAQQGTLAASKQEVTKKLRQVIRQGDALVDFLRTGAREHFGPSSEKLVEFGVQPFRSRARTASRKPPATPVPETPESPSATPNPDIPK
jgi:hypothetical protein